MDHQHLTAEAKSLRDRLTDIHNSYFEQGMPRPNTAVARARYRRLMQKASARYIRRLIAATVATSMPATRARFAAAKQ